MSNFHRQSAPTSRAVKRKEMLHTLSGTSPLFARTRARHPGASYLPVHVRTQTGPAESLISSLRGQR